VWENVDSGLIGSGREFRQYPVEVILGINPEELAGADDGVNDGGLPSGFRVPYAARGIMDMTYVRTAEGWLYVSAILDLWSRRIVGWACGATMHVSLVLATLNDAIRRRRPPPGVIHHSDRGSQYVDAECIAALDAAGFIRSMSAKGNCFDNAAMESFWSSYKTESDLEEKLPATRHDGNLVTFDYIETFYNRTRRHSSLDYTSPVAFEIQHTNRKDTKAA
jgi:putative transposase